MGELPAPSELAWNLKVWVRIRLRLVRLKTRLAKFFLHNRQLGFYTGTLCFQVYCPGVQLKTEISRQPRRRPRKIGLVLYSYLEQTPAPALDCKFVVPVRPGSQSLSIILTGPPGLGHSQFSKIKESSKHSSDDIVFKQTEVKGMFFLQISDRRLSSAKSDSGWASSLCKTTHTLWWYISREIHHRFVLKSSYEFLKFLYLE